jgi:hypothetical protein
METPPAQPLCFLDLPRELRDVIYEYNARYAPFELVYPITATASESWLIPQHCAQESALAYTCRQMLAEYLTQRTQAGVQTIHTFGF